MVVLATVVLGQSLPLDELALGDAGVLHRGLNHAHAVVLQVVVEDHRPHAIVLVGGVLHGLLEVAIEAKHLMGE